MIGTLKPGDRLIDTLTTDDYFTPWVVVATGSDLITLRHTGNGSTVQVEPEQLSRLMAGGAFILLSRGGEA